MAASLVALLGPLRGETLPLTAESLTIGREPSNQLHPSDLSLSRHHCVLAVAGDRVTITDLESLNGTFVNGSPIKEHPLEHGDQVKIGESVFLFLNSDSAAPDTSAIELDDTAPRPTVRLRKEDILFLQSEQIVEAFAPNPRLARELHALLEISTELGSIRTSDELQRTLIDHVFAAIPIDRAAILISDNDGGDFASVSARGRTSDAYPSAALSCAA